MSLEVTPDEIEQWLSNGIKKTLQTASEKHEPEQTDDKRNVTSKMTATYNFEALAEKFKTDAATIQATIEKMEAEFRADIPGESDEMYKHFVMHDLGKSLSGGDMKAKADEFNGVIVAVSRAKDLNDYPKRLAWKAYAENAKDAVKSGLIEEVKDESGKVVKKIPLETRETLQNGDPNPNFGKPIEYKRAREMIMMLVGNQKIDGVEVPGNGEIVLVRANLDNVSIGCKSTIYGKKSAASNKPYTSVVRGWSDFYDENGTYSNSWSVASKIYENYYFESRVKDDLGNVTATKIKKLTIDQIASLPSFGIFVTKGNVQTIKTSEDGTKVYLSINDDDGNAVRASTSYEPLMNTVEDLCEGDEVILIAERSSFKDEKEDKWINYNILMGAIKNPAENDLADGLKRLAEIRKKKA